MPPNVIGVAGTVGQDAQGKVQSVCSNLNSFSNDELAVVSHILLAILHVKSFQDLLQEIHVALNRLIDVKCCAMYRVSSHGRGFRVAFQTGDHTNYLPDLIPQGTNLFKSITNRKLIDIRTSRCLQPSLFDDQPISMFGPLVVDNHLVGALSVTHSAPDTHFVSTILNEAVIALELLYKADTFADSLSMRAHFGEDTRIKHEPDPMDLDDGYAKLTPREKEVLALLARGMSNKELADSLYISAATCKHHVESILAKLHVHNRAAAVSIGFAHPK